jgi:hypothetical protein
MIRVDAELGVDVHDERVVVRQLPGDRRAVSAVSPFAAYRPANSSSSAAGMSSTSSQADTYIMSPRRSWFSSSSWA